MEKVVKIVVVIAAIAIAIGLIGFGGVFSNMFGSTRDGSQPAGEEILVASGDDNSTIIPDLIVDEILAEDLDLSDLEEIEEIQDLVELEDLEEIGDLEEIEDLEDIGDLDEPNLP